MVRINQYLTDPYWYFFFQVNPYWYLTDTYQYLTDNCRYLTDIEMLRLRLNHYIQDKALYNGRILEGTLFLVCSLHWLVNLSKCGNINSIFHSDKISADSKCWSRYVSEMILTFSAKLYIFVPDSDQWHMNKSSFRFAFNAGFNLPSKVLAYSNEKWYIISC